MTSRKDWFCNNIKETVSNLEVIVANDGKLRWEGVGNIQINLKNDVFSTTICDVILIPGLRINSLSVSKLISYVVIFYKDGCELLDNNVNSSVIETAINIGGIYRLNFSEDNFSYSKIDPCQILANAVILDNHGLNNHGLWHKCLVHLYRISMRLLRDNMAIGVNFSNGDENRQCVPCIEGKQSKKPFKTSGSKRVKANLELLHADQCGPMSVSSWSGAKLYPVLLQKKNGQAIKSLWLLSKIYPERNKHEREFPDHVLYNTICFENTACKPDNFHDCDLKKNWKNAMKKEYQSLIDNETWDLVDLPANKKAVSCKWVYNLKSGAHGKKCKARLDFKRSENEPCLFFKFRNVNPPISKPNQYSIQGRAAMVARREKLIRKAYLQSTFVRASVNTIKPTDSTPSRVTPTNYHGNWHEEATTKTNFIIICVDNGMFAWLSGLAIAIKLFM
ncbi:hypothetical protein JTB14_012917 [Gonioctena quinquepunctata]|nr:hypothetical protein JTB14_012917 [Gonioctena quinquepunctata]